MVKPRGAERKNCVQADFNELRNLKGNCFQRVSGGLYPETRSRFSMFCLTRMEADLSRLVSW